MLFALLRTQPDQEHDADEEKQTALAARHDVEAFVDLYHRYLDPIYRYCYRRLNSPDAAEDATSQVFERAWRSIHQYRGGSFRAWLFRIAYTTVVDTWKRPTPITSEIDPEISDPDPTPEQRAMQRESGENVQELLEQLTEEQARVIELRIAGLKGPEIAEAMDRSPESVRMLQHRGIERLRRYLENDQPVEADDGSA
jgi:RNA polymerase sigma-70 factor, ECF subfamily